MIDKETDIFDAVYPYLEDLLPTGGFVSEYVPEPESLPHVSLIEIDNTPDQKTVDSSHHEWSSIVTYESNVYATDKGTCRSIQAALDNAMIGLIGFSKISGQFTPNLADPRIYRITCRYTRGITINGDFYRPK